MGPWVVSRNVESYFEGVLAFALVLPIWLLRGAVGSDACIVCLNFLLHTGVFLTGRWDKSRSVADHHPDHLDLILVASGG